MYSTYNQNKLICAIHSSLDNKSPSLQPLLEKYRQNRDWDGGSPVHLKEHKERGNWRETRLADSCCTTKLKLEWTICNTDEYVSNSRWFKCSRYNHRHTECRSEDTWPLRAEKHKLKECPASRSDYKCINCVHSTHTTKTGKPMRAIHHSIGTAPACRRWSFIVGRIQTTDMAETVKNRIRIIQVHKRCPLATIRCMQITLHSRMATDNLRKLIEQENSDILLCKNRTYITTGW